MATLSDRPELSTRRVHYEMSERTRAIAAGGLGVIQQLVDDIGLAEQLDEELSILKRHRPYYVSRTGSSDRSSSPELIRGVEPSEIGLNPLLKN